ncbi:AcrR family transcriptional regulator [Rhodanobacter sp. MP1X3]|nr:TetR/AcrR family transcriptional regulator [Rhodanobacter sp. MP1X3]MBB6242463.1 AcrR family transcriptional regulator [Rhodanobacter sp. MP1X3]
MRRPPSSLRPRKKPVQPRAVETYAWILETAAQILEAQGIGAFNTNLVAERAGVSIGSLYQYFPGKDALLIALMRRKKERLGEDALAALAAPDGHAALAHLVAAAVRHQLGRPELARLLDVEETRPEAQQEVENASNYRGLLRTILDRSDLPPQPNPEIATDDLASLVRMLVDAAGVRGESNAEQLERRVLGALLGYLGASTRP